MRWTLVKTVRVIMASLLALACLCGILNVASAATLNITAGDQNLTSKSGLNNKPCTTNTVAVTASNSTYQITASNIPAACNGQTIIVQTFGSTSGASLQQTGTITGTSITFGTALSDAYHVTGARVLLNGWYTAASWAYTPVCTPYTTITATASSSNSTATQTTDGDFNTSWIGDAVDPQSLTFDMGASQGICKSTLTFGTNYGTNITFGVSSNGSSYTTAYTISPNTQTAITLGNGASTLISTRYLRLNVNARFDSTVGVEVKEWQIWVQK